MKGCLKMSVHESMQGLHMDKYFRLSLQKQFKTTCMINVLKIWYVHKKKN